MTDPNGRKELLRNILVGPLGKKRRFGMCRRAISRNEPSRGLSNSPPFLIIDGHNEGLNERMANVLEKAKCLRHQSLPDVNPWLGTVQVPGPQPRGVCSRSDPAMPVDEIVSLKLFQEAREWCDGVEGDGPVFCEEERIDKAECTLCVQKGAPE